MGHPLMFDDDDPVLARLRRIALDLPGSREKITHGHPAFFTTRVFAYFGGSIKVDGTYVQHPHSVVVRPPEEERRALRTAAVTATSELPDASLTVFVPTEPGETTQEGAAPAAEQAGEREAAAAGAAA